MNRQIEAVAAWGRSQGQNVTDCNGQQFNQEFTEQLRLWLRAQYLANTIGVDGSWRTGYDCLLETGEVVGVTNGYGRFRVFYHKPTDVTVRIASKIYLAEAA